MMKRSVWLLIVMCCYAGTGLTAQVVDSLVDVGGYKVHFHVLKGKGTPILFESGGGDDATVWKDILQPVADSTGATLITYDRAGFGQSELDFEKHGLVKEVTGLENGLKTLGFSGDFVLVAHSLGGFYATLFAARNSHKVKGVVFIDANLACFFTDEHMDRNRSENENDMKHLQADKKWGVYYIYADMESNVKLLRRVTFPPNIPVTDIVAEKSHFPDAADFETWKACHQEFVKASPNRRAILASGSGHYIYRSNPKLVIDAIVSQYFQVTGR
jgi:pimeloyl-ACP methyl ester carboxylesterase